MTDRAHASVEFAMAVGVLMLPVALVVMSFGPWLETRVWVESAAAEAARATAIALDHDAGNEALAEMASDRDLEPGSYRVGWCGSPSDAPDSVIGGCRFGRGAQVAVMVEVWTPLFSTPWGDVGGLWVGATHSEHVDLYRSLG